MKRKTTIAKEKMFRIRISFHIPGGQILYQGEDEQHKIQMTSVMIRLEGVLKCMLARGNVASH